MSATFTGRSTVLYLSGLALLSVLPGIRARAQTPVSSFSVNISAGCAPLNVTFANNSTQANSYYWNFGNGNTSTLANPSMVYLSPGNYSVSLVAINTISNQRDTSMQMITVVPDPVASFTAGPLTSCAGTAVVAFTNTSVNTVSYLWDFGDGNSSTAANPTHIYTTAGNYTVKLIANNAYGCSDIYIAGNYVHIRPNPVAAFTSNLSSSCNVNTVFNFTCTTQGVITCFWNFGDGATSALVNPSHTYVAPGAYTITLVVTDANGCMDTLVSPDYIHIGNSLIPSFTVNTVNGCAPLGTVFTCTVPNATSWLWDFGDGSTSSQQNPTHIYAGPGSYSISLTVTTVSGCNGSVTLNNYINVDPLPVASFTMVQDSGCIPFTAQFNNTSAGAVSWLWDFGDGTNSSSQNPTHQYNSTGNYAVTLHAYSANGCETILTIPNAIVTQEAVSSFSGTNIIGCPPLTVTFNSNSSGPGIVSWFWLFGDGSTSTLQNPSHVYNTIGNYIVKLIVTNSLGCMDTLTRYNYIKVVSGVTNYTVPDTIKLCQPGVLSCVDPTLGSNSWFWDFGDGGTSSIKNPVHTYNTPGIYTVTLTNNMSGGCIQTFNPYAIVHVFPVTLVPINSIMVSPCPPYVASFSNNSGGVSSYLWDFGDGTTSTLPNPSHTYASAGTYTITLTLGMFSGCTTALTQTVIVGHANPTAVNNTKFCLGDPTLFSITNPGAFTSYLWNFGDSTTSTLVNPSHTYAGIGVYNAGVTITDTSGCVYTYPCASPITVSNPVPSFSVSGPTTGCSNLLVTFNNTSVNAISYVWDFGDGTYSTATHPTHMYSNPGVYTVTLTATSNGCTHSTVHPNQVIVNAAQCNFMYNYNSSCLPVTANFTDLSPNAVSWAWDFGDGTTSSLQNPVHTYTTPPTGNITLTIVDVFGCTKSRTKPAINFLQAAFQLSDSLICRHETIGFTDLSSPGIGWHWDFGDGQVSNLQNPVHQYAAGGIYTVSLVVTFAQGCQDTTVKTNCITVSAPQADFISPTVSGCSPSQINFSNLSANGTGFLWYFGDSTTSTVQTPSHIYSIPGYYTIDLVAYDSIGCTDTMTRVDYIVIPGTYSQFTLSSATGCEMFSAQFTDLSINAASWSWNFGDGYTSAQQNPAHVYTDSGSYVVTLITQDTLGCTSFYSFPTPVMVYSNPVAGASTADTAGCEPYHVNFSNLSVYADSYLWIFGDGDTSTQVNPSHTYLSPGNYLPMLVASTLSGCIDTFYIAPGIRVHQNPQSIFTAGAAFSCSPASITFTSQSSNLNQPVYNWYSGNGLTSGQLNANFYYPVAGTYTVSLVVTNSNGCRDSGSQQVTVNASPVANASMNAASGCSPTTVSFTNLSFNAASYSWLFGDGGSDTAANPAYTYLQSGTFPVTLIANNSNGCADTFLFPQPVQVNQKPVADFAADPSAGCPGSTFSMTDLSTGTIPGSTYSWTVGSVFSSGQQHPAVTLNIPGYYDVTLVVNNQNGCSDSITKSQLILVYDSMPPPICPLKSVSVLDDNRVEIRWTVSNASDFAAYILSRYDPAQNKFIPILVDSNQYSGGLLVTPGYIDSGLYTLNNVYTYLLETTDLCGNSFSGSVLIPHSTINISAQAIGKDIQVNWTAYAGTWLDAYELSRMELPSGNWQVIDTTGSAVTSYLDTTLQCPVAYAYRVLALNLGGEGYVSMSDTAAAIPENKMADQEVDIIRSTVINNSEVLTEWLSPVLFPDRVVMYNIYRSTDSLHYHFIAAVPAQSQSYLDSDVDVMKQNYFYRILAVNDCSLESTRFTKSSSILLKSDSKDAKTILYWTEYRQWDSGVNQYVIEQLDSNGQWRVIKVVDGTINAASVDE